VEQTIKEAVEIKKISIPVSLVDIKQQTMDTIEIQNSMRSRGGPLSLNGWSNRTPLSNRSQMKINQLISGTKNNKIGKSDRLNFNSSN